MNEELPPSSLIDRLPFEILANILAQIAIDNPQQFVRTLLIGREFWIPYRSALLWEPICRFTYPELETGQANPYLYGGYYEMFHKRPAVRFNGIYVCVARYFREGEIDGISFYRHRHEVRYFRYSWLNPDGTARSLLSNFPPRKLLGLDGITPPAAYLTDVMDGHWKLDSDTHNLSIRVDGGAHRRHYFCFDMEVASSGGKVHNKLKWKRYWCEERSTGNTADFSLTNEGSFYFHKLDRNDRVSEVSDSVGNLSIRD